MTVVCESLPLALKVKAHPLCGGKGAAQLRGVRLISVVCYG
jgi:hypothetical protein